MLKNNNNNNNNNNSNNNNNNNIIIIIIIIVVVVISVESLYLLIALLIYYYYCSCYYWYIWCILAVIYILLLLSVSKAVVSKETSGVDKEMRTFSMQQLWMTSITTVILKDGDSPRSLVVESSCHSVLTDVNNTISGTFFIIKVFQFSSFFNYLLPLW